MIKGALISCNEKIENNTDIQLRDNGLFPKIMQLLNSITNKKIRKEIIETKSPDVEIYSVQVDCYDDSHQKTTKNLEKVFKWIRQENIEILAFDDYLLNNYKDLILKYIKEDELEKCNGRKIFLTILIRILKKLLKAKGLDINQIEMALISDELSRVESEYINSLAPNLKYLTYVNNKSYDRALLDQIYDKYGFAIRSCNSIKECIGEVGLIINLKYEKINLSDVDNSRRIIILDSNNDEYYNNGNITFLNDIIINLSSKINIPKYINNRNKFKLCEMYMLISMGKKSLLNNELPERDFNELYTNFKNNGFKVDSLEGINL